MTKKIRTLNDLFLDELADLHSAEAQLIKALPKMMDAALSSDLRQILTDHLQVTESQLKRLDDIFVDLHEKPAAITCKAMKGLIEEGEDILKKADRCPTRDAAIIGASQRIEHYEIAAYGTAQSHAEVLGLTHARALLKQILTEEKMQDSHLNGLAIASINIDAKQHA